MSEIDLSGLGEQARAGLKLHSEPPAPGSGDASEQVCIEVYGVAIRVRLRYTGTGDVDTVVQVDTDNIPDECMPMAVSICGQSETVHGH